MLIKKAVILLLIVCFGCALSSTAFAQATDNGSLTGSVTDQNGAVVQGATVTVRNLGTNLQRTATANEEGRYTFNVLPLGDYEIRAEAASFQPVVVNATVVASTATPVDLVLGVTVQENVVDVSGGGNESLVNQNDTPTISSTITGQALEDTPLVNRNALGRLQLDTSTSGDIANPLENGNGNPEISVNGTRTTSQGVQFNGIDATNVSGTGSLTESIAPAPETVQEVSFLSNLYDASLGRNGGGSVQVVTKSGTNNFTGTAYIYAQNEAFNANDFFFNRDGIDRQRARRLEGGFTIGGPVIKDKLFFFGGYQKTDASTAYVPTASTFIVLPEALAFITDRSNPENVRQAFALTQQRRGSAGGIFSSPACVRSLPPNVFSGIVRTTCIDPTSPGYRYFTARNPVTGDFYFPTLIPGRFERLFVDPNNVVFTSQGRVITDLAQIGLPEGLPLLDLSNQEIAGGGQPLVRFRNVFPAEFAQDQFTTRLDYTLSKGDSEGRGANTLSGTFFFANFPATDPFSNDTVISPTPLVRDDKNRTLAITDTHIFNGSLINEARFGYFYLDNSRQLDPRFLTPELTNQGLGIINPASAFEPGPASQRGARFVGLGNLGDFSAGAPNDIFNQREQVTLTFADNLTFTRGRHTLRFGVEHKRNFFDTNLPEEQGIEFEGLENFNQLLVSYVPEADVSLGITDKRFRFNDLSFYVSDDWRLSERLTLNLGLRWDWFAWPTEKEGRFTNFDFSRLSSTEDILPGFILPSNTVNTGFNAIDASLPALARVDNQHTLNGQDLNNFAPRFGFAFKPFKNSSTLIRGGYGIFYDRPSAAFINTIYSNFPFYREIEARFEAAPNLIQGQTAFAGQNPNLPFINYFPFRAGGNPSTVPSRSPYVLLDNTPVYGGRTAAEPLEYRAVDRDLKTPLVQQFNLGVQQEFGRDFVVEARYVGTRGQQLLLAVGFNQPYDLNDVNTPDYIYGRLNRILRRSPVAGVSERQNGATTGPNDTRTFGSCNPSFAGVAGYTPCRTGPVVGGIDLNLPGNDFSIIDTIISPDVRVPFLGFDPTEAVILQSRGYSFYHAAQLNVTKRLSNSFGFNASYTFSKSIDIGSTDPGSTTASGRPDTPNLGLVVQGDQRNLNSNRGLSDFDRPHRLSASFVYELPFFNSNNKFLQGFQLSGFGQIQSGTPFSIFATDASFDPFTQGSDTFADQFQGISFRAQNRNGVSAREQRYNVGLGSGTIFNAAFGRPSVTSLELLRRQGSDPTRQYFNTGQRSVASTSPDGTVIPADPNAALVAPLGGFGNLGRNVLRGPMQRRIDLSLQKSTRFSERLELELKWDVFNVFNFVNFANPNSDLSDETDFGQITRTVGAPRVMQFGAKLRF